MQGKSQRFAELDFFRGLVLLVIVVDHIGGSMLSRFTLHAFALNDAAEVFVFLGGFATATAYASLAARQSESAARGRFVKRSLEIYRAFLVTAALMLLASFVLTTVLRQRAESRDRRSRQSPRARRSLPSPISCCSSASRTSPRCCRCTRSSRSPCR